MNNDYDMYSLCIMGIFISFLGFILENIWLAITKGFIDNRNMHLPFLLGYGMVVIGIYFLFGTPQKVVMFGKWNVHEGGKSLYFVMTFLVVSFGEFLLGTIMERLCKFNYWNYEWLPLHFGKYVSVFTSLGFTMIIFLFMEYVFPAGMRLIYANRHGLTKIACLCITTAMILDFLISFYQMYQAQGGNTIWKINLTQGGLNRQVM